MNPENFDQPTFAEVVQTYEDEITCLRSQLSARDAVVRALRESIRALAESPPMASASLCCRMVRPGRYAEGSMHDGGCRDRHGGVLGKTYYLHDVSVLLTGEGEGCEG